mmetsp:Transcript_49886/g.99270  ORF Transcript_49886/g.99270 Transcript_49886/m.99270 type:complete len:295 (-) Transcript_49886:263-1147(-)
MQSASSHSGRGLECTRPLGAWLFAEACGRRRLRHHCLHLCLCRLLRCCRCLRRRRLLAEHERVAEATLGGELLYLVSEEYICARADRVDQAHGRRRISRPTRELQAGRDPRATCDKVEGQAAQCRLRCHLQSWYPKGWTWCAHGNTLAHLCSCQRPGHAAMLVQLNEQPDRPGLRRLRGAAEWCVFPADVSKVQTHVPHGCWLRRKGGAVCFLAYLHGELVAVRAHLLDMCKLRSQPRPSRRAARLSFWRSSCRTRTYPHFFFHFLGVVHRYGPLLHPIGSAASTVRAALACFK